MKIERTGSKVFAEVSHSSLSLAIRCPLEFYYRYVLNLGSRVGAGSSYKADFGTCLHVALPHWTLSGSVEEAISKLESVWNIPPERQDKYYNLDRARSIVTTYASKYDRGDGRDLLSIAHLGGSPLIEIEAKAPLVVKPDLEIVYVGILDRIAVDPEDSGLWNLDIKTTGSSIAINDAWAKSQTISDQFVGYSWLMNQFYGLQGLKVNGTIVDSIYTKNISISRSNFRRFRVERNLDMERFWQYRVERVVRDIMVPIALGDVKAWGYPPSSCMRGWGGCSFLGDCNGTPESIESQIDMMRELYEPYRVEVESETSTD